MKRIIFFLTLVAPMLCMAQQPSTQPVLRYDWSGISNNNLGIAVKLRVTLADEFPDIRFPGELGNAFRNLGVVAMEDEAVLPATAGNVGSERESLRIMLLSIHIYGNKNFSQLFPEQWRLLQSGNLSEREVANRRFLQEIVQPERKKIADRFVGQLRTAFRADQDISAQDRARRVTEISQAIEALEARQQAFLDLTNAQPSAPKRQAEKVRQLYEMEQGLQMRRTALEARREAIQRGLRDLQQQANVQRNDDPIVLEMQRIVALRERELQRRRDNRAAFAQAEIEAAEAEIAEARLRLLERQATLGKAGRGELMDRLTDELAMVSIDFTELQIQLALLRDQIAANDPAKLTGPALEELLKREPGLDPAKISSPLPLYQELERQKADLRLEWLTLVVDDVEIAEEPTTQPRSPTNDL